MVSCAYCGFHSEGLRKCVCGKVSYCNKECQSRDWRRHMSSCPPYKVREVPGMGRGLFATRNIKKGQIIFEEYPLLTVVIGEEMSYDYFRHMIFPTLDEDTKEKILNLHDPVDNLRDLDKDQVHELLSTNSNIQLLDKKYNNEPMKMFRIFAFNSLPFCELDVSPPPKERFLYQKIPLINHSCNPNVIRAWVRGDYRRKQVRAIKMIEKDEEIMLSYLHSHEFSIGSREFRRKELLVWHAFLCHCPVCSMEGDALAEDERIRLEIREKTTEIELLMPLHQALARKSLKKVMMLHQRKIDLVQELDLSMVYFGELLISSEIAVYAKKCGVPAPDPEICKQEALEFAKKCGDVTMYIFNKWSSKVPHKERVIN